MSWKDNNYYFNWPLARRLTVICFSTPSRKTHSNKALKSHSDGNPQCYLKHYFEPNQFKINMFWVEGGYNYILSRERLMMKMIPLRHEYTSIFLRGMGIWRDAPRAFLRRGGTVLMVTTTTFLGSCRDRGGWRGSVLQTQPQAPQ